MTLGYIFAPFDDSDYFPYEFLRDEFRACTIKNILVYFSHGSSHSENVASARRVYDIEIRRKFGSGSLR